jgi:hypothetical protein
LGRGFEWRRSSLRGDISKRVLIHKKYLKHFLSRTTGTISIKLGTNYPWIKGIKVCSNKGPNPFQREDNQKNIKNAVGSFKNLLKNHWINFKLTYHKLFWGEGIQVCSNEEGRLSQSGDNGERVKVN